MFRSILHHSAVYVILMGAVNGGDWPQILGLNRDGIAVDESLLPEWPQTGPEQIWSAKVGQGFAGVAVKGQQLILFHRNGDREIVEARNAATGREIWTSPSPCDYQSGLSSDAGPRCVPLIAGKHVYTFGVQGTLRCLKLSDGEEVWKRDTWRDFEAPEGYFGAGSTPLLFEDRLIVNVGGRKDAAIVAFSVTDGNTLWQAFDDTASYSSPIAVTVDGTTHVVAVTRLNTVSLNPENGETRFAFSFGARGPTVNGACPVFMNDHLFISSSYRVGSVWAKLSSNDANVTKSGESLLATQYATPVKHKGLLYAVDGRQDVGDASVCCIDPERQKLIWRQEGFDYGSLIRVQDELLLLTHRGDLVRFNASRDGYEEAFRCQVLESTARGYRLPALSGGRLFIRDDSVLKCLQVGSAM